MIVLICKMPKCHIFSFQAYQQLQFQKTEFHKYFVLLCELKLREIILANLKKEVYNYLKECFTWTINLIHLMDY